MLKFQHGLYPAKYLHLKCGEQGCSSSFCTYNGFRKHLNTVHNDEPVNTNQEVATQKHFEFEFSSDEPKTSAAPMLQVPPVITQNSIERMCGSIVAHLQTSGISQSTVQTIVCSVEEVISDVQSQAREAVLQTFSSETKESEIHKKIEHSLNQLGNPFSTFNTDRKRQKEFVLGVRMDTRTDRTTGAYSQIPVTDKYTYVPILGTLKSILKNSESRECFLQEKHCKNGVYKDINDGLYYQNHPLLKTEACSSDFALL